MQLDLNQVKQVFGVEKPNASSLPGPSMQLDLNQVRVGDDPDQLGSHQIHNTA